MSKLLSMLMENGESDIIYAPKLNGTEQITVLSGDVSIQNNILKGGSGYLTQGWNNITDWELTFYFRYVSNYTLGGFYIIAPNMVERDNTEFLFTGDNRIYIYENKVSHTSGYFMTLPFPSDWTLYKFRKVSTNQLQLTVGNRSQTLTWTSMNSLSQLCIGVDSWGGTFEMKNIAVRKL